MNATAVPLLRPARVCERLSVSKSTFYRAAERGELPVLKVFGQLRVDERELEAWLYGESKPTTRRIENASSRA